MKYFLSILIMLPLSLYAADKKDLIQTKYFKGTITNKNILDGTSKTLQAYSKVINDRKQNTISITFQTLSPNSEPASPVVSTIKYNPKGASSEVGNDGNQSFKGSVKFYGEPWKWNKWQGTRIMENGDRHERVVSMTNDKISFTSSYYLKDGTKVLDTTGSLDKVSKAKYKNAIN